jgi:hypothetical protein
LLDITYEPLLAVVRATDALKSGAPCCRKMRRTICASISGLKRGGDRTDFSRRRPTSCDTTPGCRASPASQWSRNPRSDAWRHCPRCRPGVDREQLLRASEWTAAGGELHGLPDAPRRHLAAFGDRAERSPGADEPARRPSRGRGRHDTGACCGGNAIVDALAKLGVRHIEMPATPERVWRAIRAAATGRM